MTDLATIIQHQRQDHQDKGAPDLAWRQSQLKTAIALLNENNTAIIAAVNQDFTFRSAALTQFADIDSVTATLQYTLNNVAKWMQPEKRKLPFNDWLKGHRAYINYQPLGVIGVITPWNAPVALLFLALAGIFAAGNRAVLKPSHQLPATTNLLQDLFATYFDSNIATIVNGDVEFAKTFAAADFDHLIYTGNSQIGAEVMQLAAQNLTPVTLELGGSSPVIIGETENLTDIVEKIWSAKMVNAGQLCIAPDVVYIKEDALQAFLQLSHDYMQKTYPENDATADYPKIFSHVHHQHLVNLLNDVKEKDVVTMALLDNNTEFVPALVINPSIDSKICQHDIFGPIIRLHTYQTIEQVSEHINNTLTPLALYYFGDDKNTIDLLKNKNLSGGLTINDVMTHAFTPELPFGGVGTSGMGRYGGKAGFQTFSNSLSVYQKP